MSNSHLFMTSGFPRAPMQNGIGRYIPQLKRITLKFCKSNGSSRGFREFIETELVDYAKSNPAVVVYVKPRRHRSPTLTAEYLNGQREYLNCHNYTKEEVYKWIGLLTNRAGKETMRYKKLWHTESPSIQGIWTPTTFRDPKMNLTSFPMENMSGPKNPPPTATELLKEMYEKEKMGANIVVQGENTMGQKHILETIDANSKTFSK